MKLSNGKAIGIFIETLSSEVQEKKEGSIALFDLSKRKTLNSSSFSIQNEEGLSIANKELVISQNQPHKLSINTGKLVSSK